LSLYINKYSAGKAHFGFFLSSAKEYKIDTNRIDDDDDYGVVLVCEQKTRNYFVFIQMKGSFFLYHSFHFPDHVIFVYSVPEKKALVRAFAR
jgi:hypothetical protein